MYISWTLYTVDVSVVDMYTDIHSLKVRLYACNLLFTRHCHLKYLFLCVNVAKSSMKYAWHLIKGKKLISRIKINEISCLISSSIINPLKINFLITHFRCSLTFKMKNIKRPNDSWDTLLT